MDLGITFVPRSALSKPVLPLKITDWYHAQLPVVGLIPRRQIPLPLCHPCVTKGDAKDEKPSDCEKTGNLVSLASVSDGLVGVHST